MNIDIKMNIKKVIATLLGMPLGIIVCISQIINFTALYIMKNIFKFVNEKSYFDMANYMNMENVNNCYNMLFFNKELQRELED